MKNKTWIGMMVLILLVLPFVSAGVGVKWNQESMIVEENKESCLNYSVYNPWPDDSYVIIEVSDELKDILVMQEAESKLIPKDTSSSEAIPVEFCFKVPEVYDKNCLVGDIISCEKKCDEEQKVYEGEVVVKSTAPPASAGGSGGSATTMAVSAPLRIRVQCTPPSGFLANLSAVGLMFILIAIITIIVIVILVYRKYRKSPLERDKEKLKKLQEKIRRAEKNRK